MDGLDRLIRLSRERRALPPPGVCRQLRVGVGLTQLEVAEVLACDRSTVARWELGSRTPRGELARAYAELLGRLALEEAARD